MGPPRPPTATIASLASTSNALSEETMEFAEPGSLRAQRDATVAAHAHQFKKVLELSDVVIQVSEKILSDNISLSFAFKRCLTRATQWGVEVDWWKMKFEKQAETKCWYWL